MINNEMNLNRISFFQTGGVKETWSPTTSFYPSGWDPEHPHLHLLQTGEADFGIWKDENRHLSLRL